MGLPVFLLFIIDKIDNDKIGLKVRKLNLKDTYTYVFLIIITAFLILPYFKNINMINWKNLLFIDVYDSRQLDDIEDRKSTRLNSSHVASSYAVSCLKKKKKKYSN